MTDIMFCDFFEGRVISYATASHQGAIQLCREDHMSVLRSQSMIKI